MTTRQLFRGASTMCFALAAVIGCESPTAPRGPVAGTLDVVFRTANANDGAVRVRLAGPDLRAVESVDVALQTGIRDGTTQMVAFGILTDGTVLAHLNVPDVNAALEYSGTVVEAAARMTYAQQPLEGYRIEFIRR